MACTRNFACLTSSVQVYTHIVYIYTCVAHTCNMDLFALPFVTSVESHRCNTLIVVCVREMIQMCSRASSYTFSRSSACSNLRLEYLGYIKLVSSVSLPLPVFIYTYTLLFFLLISSQQRYITVPVRKLGLCCIIILEGTRRSNARARCKRIFVSLRLAREAV